jgi:hypothetical protein
MATNPEYLAVLAEVARSVQSAMHDHRLPDLTLEQVAQWLQSVTFENLQIAMALPEDYKPEPSGKGVRAEAFAA